MPNDAVDKANEQSVTVPVTKAQYVAWGIQADGSELARAIAYGAGFVGSELVESHYDGRDVWLYHFKAPANA